MKFDINEVKEYISKSSKSSKIYIGADSYRFLKNKKWYAEYTVAIVIHKDGNRGCKVFGKTTYEVDYDTNKNKPSLRLMNEVYKAAEMYLELFESFGERHVEVHLDVNPNIIHGSSCVVQQAIGYIRGVCNVIPMVKPQAFAASCAADKLKGAI